MDSYFLISRWGSDVGKHTKDRLFSLFPDLGAIDSLLKTSEVSGGLKSGLVDLRGLNFTGFNLKAGGLNHCSFDYSVFSECEFNEMDFQSSCFNGVKMTNCTFKNCVLTTCGLVGSQFYSCKFLGCDFSFSELSCSGFFDSEIYDSRFSGANLFGVSFQKVDMGGLDFSEAYIERGLLDFLSGQKEDIKLGDMKLVSKLEDSPVCFRSDVRELAGHPVYRDRVKAIVDDLGYSNFVEPQYFKKRE